MSPTQTQVPAPPTLLFTDEDGMQFDVPGWYKPDEHRLQYLVRCSRAEIKGIITHSLVEDIFMPKYLKESCPLLDEMDMGNSKNRGAQRIRLQDITRVLDLVWCSSYERECTSKCLESLLQGPNNDKSALSKFFVLLEWNDEGISRVTWEFAQTLISLLDFEECTSLLVSWSKQVERRQDYLVNGVPAPEEVSRPLGNISWQTKFLELVPQRSV